MSERNPPGFWSVWVTVAMDLLGFGIIIPLLPLYAGSFGASAVTIGILFASYSLAQFVMSPVWGKLSDRVGRRPVLLITIAGSAVGSLVLGLAGSIAVLFVGRIVDGSSGASVAVARSTVADVATAEERPRLMGLLGAAYGFGFVIGPAIGSLAALGGPSVPFLVAAGISVVNGVITWFRVPETRPEASSPSLAKARMSDLPSAVRRLVVLTFVGVTAFAAFEATFSLLAEARLALGESGVALLFAGVGVFLVGTQVGLVGPAAAALGESRLLQVGLTLNAAGLVLLALAESWVSLVPGLALLALGQGWITPTLSSAVAGAAPSGSSGAALGVQQSAGGLARVVGPALGGALYGVGIPIPYLVAAAMTLAALPLVPGRRRRQPAEVPA